MSSNGEWCLTRWHSFVQTFSPSFSSFYRLRLSPGNILPRFSESSNQPRLDFSWILVGSINPFASWVDEAMGNFDE